MKQLVQRLKDGWMGVIEVPPPVVGRGMVLVRSHASVISAGTEGGTVRAARKSLLGKARERPQQLAQVYDTLKQQGIVQTYRAVAKKLDAYSPLGYSLAGEVVEVAPDVRGFSVGDRVACAGAGYANHAELVAVPLNLCVKLPADADLAKAAYNTLGAIALQGVRQAGVGLGETCVVIGLGLLGQLTALLLRANGVTVIGLDIDPRAVEMAGRWSADHAFTIDAPGLPQTVDELTRGIGADAVVIAAASDNLEPVNLAGRLLRKRGTVVIVGAVPTGFEREPHFYRKELSLRMSCSYGPGRYDPAYEEKGIDYPVGYVRWTEQRNMAAFQDLVHAGRIDVSWLTTHRFPLDQAPAAYDLILEKAENVLGILIDYEASAAPAPKRIDIPAKADVEPSSRPVRISFVGAGSYAMSHILPNLPERHDVQLAGVLTASATSSRSVAERYRFRFATSDDNEIFAGDETTTVFVVTRHDTHAAYVLRALESGKQVFVEKPLCLTEAELESINAAYVDALARDGRALLMVGFNRRFSSLAIKLKQETGAGTGPLALLYRVNAGRIPADSWIQDVERGGGRILGELCHFIDFVVFLTGSLPVEVYAAAMSDPEGLNDTLAVTVSLADGSVGTIAYLANGSKALGKEHVEVYRAGVTGVLRDFKEVEIFADGRPKRSRLLGQDKGQKTMVHAFVDAASGASPAPIGVRELYATTKATFAVLESLRTRAPVRITLPEGL